TADPNPLLGQAHAAASVLDNQLALQKLQEALALHDLPKGFHGSLGRQLLENRRFNELNDWARNIPDQSVSAESWLVLAELADRANDQRGAIRCYWEAAKLRPESLLASNQLARKLASEQLPELAEPFLRRVQAMNNLRDEQQVAIMSDQPPNFADMFAMVEAYKSVGR
ncbi:MAG: hypothetical protein GY826_24470, partial [Fuerstiella sp.]|nr:hypothetical protein [Fuerstiella sp.]